MLVLGVRSERHDRRACAHLRESQADTVESAGIRALVPRRVAGDLVLARVGHRLNLERGMTDRCASEQQNRCSKQKRQLAGVHGCRHRVSKPQREENLSKPCAFKQRQQRW